MKLTYPLLLKTKPKDKSYKIRDRDSMYLRVSVSGSKVWKLDYRLDGKDCSYILGLLPDLSIEVTPANIATTQPGWWRSASIPRPMRSSCNCRPSLDKTRF